MEKLLQKLGFDDKESAIYLCCLKKELNTPTSLSRQLGIKRSTIYFYLEKLKEKGVITYKIKGRRKYIIAEPPERAFQEFISKENEKLNLHEKVITKLIPQLKAIIKQKTTSTQVHLYEGVEGMRIIIDRIIEENKNIYWIGSIDILLSLISEEELYRRLTLRRLKQGTTSYTITDRQILKKRKFSEIIGNFRQFRFLDKDFEIPTGLLLLGNIIVLAAKDNNDIKIVMIQDSIMSQMFHFIFMLLWNKLPDN